MKIRLLLLYHLAILFTSNSLGQNLKPINIGDTVPDVKLKMMNYKSDQVKLSEFKGRLLILDFWSTWCTYCIEAFPKMEMLQKKFQDRLVIIPVTSFGTKEYNQKFFEQRRKKGHPINLPSAVEAALIIDTLFPANGIPQEVWINENGIVIAVTDAFSVTADNIEKILKGEKISLPVKEYAGFFDQTKPLLLDKNGGENNSFLFRSIITAYNPYIRGSGPYFSDYGPSFKWIRFCNRPMIDFFESSLCAFDSTTSKLLGYDPLNKRVLSLFNDSLGSSPWHFLSSNDYAERERAKYKYLFCYELLVPNSFSLKQAYRKMYEDVSAFFKVEGVIEKRKTSCLALIRLSDKDKLQRSTTRRLKPTESELFFSLEGTSIEELVEFFNSLYNLPIVIDETNFPNKKDFINIKIADSVDFSLSNLRKLLKAYDLDLIPIQKEVDLLILKKIGN